MLYPAKCCPDINAEIHTHTQKPKQQQQQNKTQGILKHLETLLDEPTWK